MKRFSCDHFELNINAKDFNKQHLILEKKIKNLALNQKTKVILLKEIGQCFDSNTFANWVESNIANAYHLFFIIGSHQGFSQETLKLYSDSLSLSPLTFPHQIVPLIFMEQLYRAETLIENRPYHY